jgi:tRNA (guanine37-N1)-methyltransferase
MRFDIITIFPNIFSSYFAETILARAQKNNLIEIKAHDLRQWTEDNHKSVDDSPYGGGPGMVMMIEPIWKAVEEIKQKYFLSESRSGESKDNDNEPLRRAPLELAQGISSSRSRVILFSAKGKPYTQADARRLAAEYDQIIMICGRYEGVDERVAEHIADEELSVGNFVLTGGEIPAMILVDSVSRLVPGVINKESLKEESFSAPEAVLLRPSTSLGTSADAQFSSSAFGGEKIGEYPQYTRPENFKDWKVPEVLLGGNHKEIKEWRKDNSKFKNQNVK